MRLVVLALLFIVGSLPALANGLDHRNVPDARLVHEDASGRYYAALMGHRDIHPSDAPDYEVTLRIYAERSTAPDGTFFEATPSPALPYIGADLVDGLHLSDGETARLGEIVIPSALEAFPEWKTHPNWNSYKDAIMINFYIDGVFLYGKGPWGEKEKNASYAAEQPVIWFNFVRRPEDRAWRPGYEGTEFLGFAQSPERRFVSTILSEREQLPNAVASERSQVLAAFDRHGAYKTKIQEEQQSAYYSSLKAKRRAGIVYKSGSFWAQYSGFDTPRKIADGQFQFIAHPADFAQAYLTFIDQFYDNCEAYLPAIRTTYTKDWFETQYGVTRHTDRYYVEMDPRFKDQYSAMMDIVNRRSLGDAATAFVDALGGAEGPNIFGWAGYIVETAATSMVAESEMGRFIQDEGCTSPLLAQYADNLWQGAAGLAPVQNDNRSYRGAAAASTGFEDADGLWHREQSWDALARNQRAGERSHPYLDEEVVAYRTGMGLANDGRDQNPTMRPIGRKLQEQGVPVLYCYYGPIGFLPNGEYDTFNVSFWFEETPEELPQFIAAKEQSYDLYPGLEYARSSCPETSGAALTVIGR